MGSGVGIGKGDGTSPSTITSSLSTHTDSGTGTASSTARCPDPCVEYIGRTALVVTGPYTGARYRFGQPGARLPVDVRDRPALLSIPMLRSVEA